MTSLTMLNNWRRWSGWWGLPRSSSPLSSSTTSFLSFSFSNILLYKSCMNTFLQRDFAVLNAAGYAIGELGCKVNLHRLLEIIKLVQFRFSCFPFELSSLLFDTVWLQGHFCQRRPSSVQASSLRSSDRMGRRKSKLTNAFFTQWETIIQDFHQTQRKAICCCLTSTNFTRAHNFDQFSKNCTRYRNFYLRRRPISKCVKALGGCAGGHGKCPSLKAHLISGLPGF